MPTGIFEPKHYYVSIQVFKCVSWRLAVVDCKKKTWFWLLLNVLQSMWIPVSSNTIGFSKMILKSYEILQRSILVVFTVFGITIYGVNLI